MFEAAELGRKVSKQDFNAGVLALRTELLEVQRALIGSPIPVFIARRRDTTMPAPVLLHGYGGF